MDSLANKENIFGTESVWRLLVKFSIPSIISMLVNSIYNLVDQIFLGQGVGYLANAATNTSFPFTVLMLAFSLLFAVGTAANVSLNLGRKNQELAERCVSVGFMLSLICGLIILAVGEAFLVPLLNLFGTTENVLPYAIEYSRVTLLGAPLISLGIMVNDLHRADGSPRLAMICMIIGAVTNVILDAVFIFVFSWGVRGAAIATVIGQVASLALGLSRINKLRLFRFRFEYMRFDWPVIKRIVSIGISSFITQVAMMISAIVMNNVSTKYGAISKYGSDIPLTCFGIIMKLVHIMTSFVIGIGIATQPVFGYNYGAEKYDRVKKMLYAAMGVTTAVGVAGFMIFQLFPGQLISIFGQESELYNEFAVIALRYITMGVFLVSAQGVSMVLYQAIGKPILSIVLSLSRQIIFLIPSILVLPVFFGISGVMFAYPVAEVLSFMLAVILLRVEVRKLNKLILRDSKPLVPETTLDNI